MNHRKRLLLTILVIPISISSVVATARGGLFRSYDLRFDGELASYHIEDLNADGLKDVLLVLNKDKDHPDDKSFALYLQTDAGFSPQPDQVFAVPQDMVLFDIGDVAGDEKKELVYFTRHGLSYFPFNGRGFDLTARTLLQTDSIFRRPNPRTLTSWNFVADLNGDAVEEILVPKIFRCAIYFRDKTRDEWHGTEIPLAAASRTLGLYDPRFSVGNTAWAVYHTPALLQADFDADGRKDLIAVYRDSLVAFCQDERGQFSATCHHNVPLDFGAVWSGEKIVRTHIGDKSLRNYLMRVLDLNGDGILDVVALRISTRESIVNPRSELRFFFGRRDSADHGHGIHFAPEPDQILHPRGTLLVLDIFDLNRDGKRDLILPVVKVGLKNLIRIMLTKSVEVQAEQYLMRDDGLYPEKPDRKNKLVVKFTYRGGATSPVYEVEDFNGDGLLDILTSQEERRLLIFWGSRKQLFESSVGARFNIRLPQNGELVKAFDLNRDNKCDVVVNYGSEQTTRHQPTHVLKILLKE